MNLPYKIKWELDSSRSLHLGYAEYLVRCPFQILQGLRGEKN